MALRLVERLELVGLAVEAWSAFQKTRQLPNDEGWTDRLLNALHRAAEVLEAANLSPAERRAMVLELVDRIAPPNLSAYGTLEHARAIQAHAKALADHFEEVARG